MNKISAVCFGEVLWDVLPTEKKIGGAPLNVAVKLNALRTQTTMLTAIGKDKNAEGILNFFEEQQLQKTGIQKNKYPTGVVNINLDDTKNAVYDIAFPSAWDYILEENSNYENIINSDYFVFGSLVCRNEISKNTLLNYLSKTKAIKVLDLNLREPFFNSDLIKELIDKCDFLKLNDEELQIVTSVYGIKETDIEKQIEALANKTLIQSICVTLGSDGAILYHNNEIYKQEAYKVIVADTVGAGDAFLATLLVMLKKTDIKTALNYACGAGAYVASKEGANPLFSEQIIESFIN